VADGTLGIAVIGLGMISPGHILGFQAAEGARVVVLCDRDAQKARDAGRRFGVPAITDHRDVFANPAVDAVALLLPHQLHYALAREALDAGKHVYVEKPFTIHEHEAEDLIRVAASRGLTLALAENTRFVQAYLAAERVVKSGQLGEVRAVRGFIPDQILDEWAEEPDGWKRQQGGAAVIMDCAPHMLYLLTWLFGPVQSLQAIAQPYLPDVELENHGIIAGRLASGALFSMEFSSVTEYPRGERVEIYGAAGALIIDQVLDPPVIFYRGDKDPKGTALSEVPYDLGGWKRRSIGDAAQDFVAAIRAGRPPAVDLADARYTVRLLDRAYESVARGGLRVTV
jgi:predicted dehydrogenase